MTFYPCLADTASIGLRLTDNGAFAADLLLDEDATNTLLLATDGLIAPLSDYPAARIIATVSQNVTSGDNIVFGTTRWALGGISVAGNTIVLNQSGLWSVGGVISFNTAAVVGNAVAILNPTLSSGGVPIGIDGQFSNAVFTVAPATPETLCLNPTGIAYLAAGTAISMQVTHNFGGTIATALNDAVSAELWCSLVRPFTPGA